MSTDRIRMRKVFVPGGNPEHTYVPRNEHRLESQLRSAADNLCKLVTVTGMTKSGKSVLTQRIYPRASSVWIDGGSIGKEDDLRYQVIDQLDAFTSLSTTEGSQVATGIKGGVSTQVGFPGFTKSESES